MFIEWFTRLLLEVELMLSTFSWCVMFYYYYYYEAIFCYCILW